MKPTPTLYPIIILITMVALPIAPAIGHLCYPKIVKLKANNSVMWAFEGEHHAEFRIEDHGNESIATIELVRVAFGSDGVFKITALAPGESSFQILVPGVPICKVNVQVLPD